MHNSATNFNMYSMYWRKQNGKVSEVTSTVLDYFIIIIFFFFFDRKNNIIIHIRKSVLYLPWQIKKKDFSHFSYYLYLLKQ